jgi:hypothetical protein
MHTGFYWGKRESKRTPGRPGHRRKLKIKMCNRSALLGFSEVCLPNQDAAIHRLVMSPEKELF